MLLLKKTHRGHSPCQSPARIDGTLSFTAGSVSERFGTLAFVVGSKENQIRAHVLVAQDMRRWAVTLTAPPTMRAK